MKINMRQEAHKMRSSTKKNWTSVFLLLVIGLLFFISCSNFFSSDKDDRLKSHKGSISIYIPHMTSWIYETKKEINKEFSPERAYLLADKIKVEIMTAEGTEVIPPTFVIFPESDYSIDTEKSFSTINNITTGTNYRVIVSIYNNAVSTITPVVRGEKIGVTVTAESTTPVSIIGLPYSPIPLSVDAAPRSDTLTLNKEIWYSLEVTKGTTYYSANQIPYAFFTSTGIYIGDFNPTYTAKYTGTLYIGAIDTRDFGSSTMHITSVESATNEGSPTSPVTLTPNTSHIYRVGHDEGSYNTSYYSFTTGNAGNYALDVSLNAMRYSLFSDAGFSMVVPCKSNPESYEGMNFIGLSPGTTYYLKIQSDFFEPQNVRGQFINPSAINLASHAQGSIVSPETLPLNIVKSAKTGTHVYDDNSYYCFATGTLSDYSIGISDLFPSDHSISILLYTNPDFTGNIYQQSLLSDVVTFKLLNPSTTYYLKVYNETYNTTVDEASFSLEIKSLPTLDINEGSVTAPIALSLNSDHTFKIGPKNSGYDTSYYTFMTVDAGTYFLDTEISNASYYLYSDEDFTTAAGSIGTNYGTDFGGGRTAGTRYYLKLVSASSSTQVKAGRIMDPVTVSANYLGQGTIATPHVISIDTAIDAKIGNHVFDECSYYSFITGPGLDYCLNISNQNPINAPITFALSTGSFSSGNTLYIEDQITKQLLLNPNTTYYLKAFNVGMNNNIAPMFNLIINSTPPPTFIPLPVSSIYTAGNIATPYKIIWYEANVTSNKTYLLYWDNLYEGSGTYTLGTEVTAYREDRLTTYIDTEYKAYFDPYVISVPSGETKIYFKVTNPYDGPQTGTFAIKLQE